ncbi:hypothetical protein AB0O34_28460, partial [Sphaerisporangium sp. NPDC088356]|uniref:hypothetical protein n=1 Tax=Sphaerisporangium sp. NPDC088356 TaxID=3154871 RepID=UPI00341F4B4F
ERQLSDHTNLNRQHAGAVPPRAGCPGRIGSLDDRFQGVRRSKAISGRMTGWMVWTLRRIAVKIGAKIHLNLQRLERPHFSCE